MNSVKTGVLAALLVLGAGSAKAELRLTMAEATQAAISSPRPEYSPIAQKMKVSGEVVVEARISETGTVEDVKVISGNALLTPNVVKTVKDWKFKPFQENGAPTQAVATLKFNFKMN
jgi:TonB family C-terminal domain